MKKQLAEFIGTFSLVLFGCGQHCVRRFLYRTFGYWITGYFSSFGLTVVVMAYAIGPISGCHINPAITVSMLVAGKIKTRDAIGYIVAQLLGAVAAAGVLYGYSKRYAGICTG